MKKIRWAFLGCGSVTEIKSGPAFKMPASFEVVGVYRRDQNLAKEYALKHNIDKVFASAEDLISSPEVDAVYIATPPDTHKHYALMVARAGKICCIEKPMAVNSEECEEICHAFKTKGIPLFVAYYRRSLPRFLKVKELIKNNEVGVIRHMSWSFCKPPNKTDLSGVYNWRTDPKIALGGYFEDLASHGLNLFTYFFGSIIQVSGFACNQQGLYEAKDAIVANFVFEKGVTGVGHWNFGCHKKEDLVKIYGSLGVITFSVFDDLAIHIETETTKNDIYVENPKHIQEYHVRNIEKHLSGEAMHPSLGESASHTNWVMDQILK